MTWFRVGGAGIPASLKNNMNSVLNKKFGTSGENYPPKQWPDDVNLLGPLPIKNASGAIASFSDGADDVPISEGIFSWKCKQAGSGTPSPSNVRPLSGYSGMTIYQNNNQYFDKTATDTNNGYISGRWIDINGAPNTNASYNTSEYIAIKGGVTYTLSGVSGSNPSICFYDAEKTFLSGTKYNGATTLTFTTDTDVAYCRLSFREDNKDNVQLEVGATATSVRTPTAKTPIVDTFGRTIYGGSRSTDGDLNETFVKMILDGSEEWNQTNAGPYYITLPGYHKEQGFTNGSCSHFQMVPEVGLASNLTTDLTCSFYFGADQNRFYIRYDAMATKEDLKTWLSNNNVEVVYKIATPNEYQIDPISISSYLGSNNIYTDQETGECSIDYRADIDLALAALQGSRSLSASLMRSAGPEEVSEPEENIQNTEEQEGEDNAR